MYVATAITNQTRDGIPTEWRRAAPPAGLSSFSDPEVRNGVLAWVALLAETFEPRWLNVAVEIDMYSVSRPDDYHNLASLYRELYATIVVGGTLPCELMGNGVTTSSIRRTIRRSISTPGSTRREPKARIPMLIR